MGGKRSNLCAIPDPVKVYCLSSDLVFVLYERECLCFLYDMSTAALIYIAVPHGTALNQNIMKLGCDFCRMKNNIVDWVYARATQTGFQYRNHQLRTLIGAFHFRLLKAVFSSIQNNLIYCKFRRLNCFSWSFRFHLSSWNGTVV